MKCDCEFAVKIDIIFNKTKVFEPQDKVYLRNRGAINENILIFLIFGKSKQFSQNKTHSF